MLFGIYVVALVTAVLLMCVTHSESVQVPVPVPVRAISERGTLWVMLVMGKAGHRLQQGQAINLYLAHHQHQHQHHQEHLVAQQLLP